MTARPAFPEWQAANDRARAEYAETPNALNGPEWCAVCINPVHRRQCDACKAVMRMRAKRAERRVA